MMQRHPYPPIVGFSLIELMSVISIVGILATVGYTSYKKALAHTRMSEGFILLKEAYDAMYGNAFAAADYHKVVGPGCTPMACNFMVSTVSSKNNIYDWWPAQGKKAAFRYVYFEAADDCSLSRKNDPVSLLLASGNKNCLSPLCQTTDNPANYFLVASSSYSANMYPALQSGEVDSCMISVYADLDGDNTNSDPFVVPTLDDHLTVLSRKFAVLTNGSLVSGSGVYQLNPGE